MITAGIATSSAAWTCYADVVIVGSGAAGLAVAARLKEAGKNCAVITRGSVQESATAWAQGGLAAVWAAGDSEREHVADTLEAGAGLCDPTAVWDLVRSAPAAIRRLIKLGAQFDKNFKGDLDLHLEGGHHRHRVLHCGGDATGAEVERVLSENVDHDQHDSITLVKNQRLIDIIIDDHGHACGIRVIDDQGKIGQWFCRFVVLATGGIGQLWPVTSNPTIATGDGIAAAYRAGAKIQDIEFMQFHPTVLVPAKSHQKPRDRGVLISEAVRGAGAFLIDHSGNRIMAGKHPLADLAPRDVVSACEIAHLEATGEPHLFLDGTAFGRQKWEQGFPSIVAMCRERGVDPVSEPIPVRPAAHYLCGGIAADMSGRTSVPGLYAVGECAATGVQGANRLASNSITEGLVVGDRLGRLLCAEEMTNALQTRHNTPTLPSTLIDSAQLSDLKAVMQQHVFVARNEAGLSQAATFVTGMRPTDVLDHNSLDTTNLACVAQLLITAARERAESRGCHRRTDFPHTSSHWERRIMLCRIGDSLTVDHHLIQQRKPAA